MGVGAVQSTVVVGVLLRGITGPCKNTKTHNTQTVLLDEKIQLTT